LSSPTAPAPHKPLRADARRNRERVIEAARGCFAEYGLEAQMDDIADTAGVGVGTVYRHFPTKEALVGAIAEDRFRRLAEYAREALEESDPWKAFSDLMWRGARLQAEDRSVAQVMASQPGAMSKAANERSDLYESTSALIRRAQKAGVLRKDVVTDDVPVIMCGLGRIIEGAGGDGPPASWERYLAIVMDGLRAEGASGKLPPRAR
jgi:AcrR family transcriptional regulator